MAAIVRCLVNLLMLPTVWIWQTRMHYRDLRSTGLWDVFAVLFIPYCWYRSTPQIWRKLNERQAKRIITRRLRKQAVR